MFVISTAPKLVIAAVKRSASPGPAGPASGPLRLTTRPVALSNGSAESARSVTAVVARSAGLLGSNTVTVPLPPAEAGVAFSQFKPLAVDTAVCQARCGLLDGTVTAKCCAGGAES